MPKITKSNMNLYYDFTATKDSEGITVMVGKKKSTNSDGSHPPCIVYKQGLGAAADRDASLRLQSTGLPGFLPVIDAGDDYFIRAAYDKPSSKWAAVGSQARAIINDALDLSLAMLNTGIIDRDRKFMKSVDGNIDSRNAVIANGRLVFFDFEPIRVINWKAPLSSEDADSIATWKLTYETLINSLAAHLHLTPKETQAVLGRFYGTAEKILADKSPEAVKIWRELMAPPREEDLGGSYVPPSLDGTSLSAPSVISVRSLQPSAPMRAPVPSVNDIYGTLHKHLTTPHLPDGAIIERMATMAHRYANQKSQAEPNVYDALETLIKKANMPSKAEEKAMGMVTGMKEYLDKAYSSQLHDPDELWARPRGPWGH